MFFTEINSVSLVGCSIFFRTIINNNFFHTSRAPVVQVKFGIPSKNILEKRAIKLNRSHPIWELNVSMIRFLRIFRDSFQFILLKIFVKLEDFQREAGILLVFANRSISRFYCGRVLANCFLWGHVS